MTYDVAPFAVLDGEDGSGYIEGVQDPDIAAKKKAPPLGGGRRFLALGACDAGEFVLFDGVVGPGRLSVRQPDIGPRETTSFNPSVDGARGLSAVTRASDGLVQNFFIGFAMSYISVLMQDMTRKF